MSLFETALQIALVIEPLLRLLDLLHLVVGSHTKLFEVDLLFLLLLDNFDLVLLVSIIIIVVDMMKSGIEVS